MHQILKHMATKIKSAACGNKTKGKVQQNALSYSTRNLLKKLEKYYGKEGLYYLKTLLINCTLNEQDEICSWADEIADDTIAYQMWSLNNERRKLVTEITDRLTQLIREYNKYINANYK